MPLFLFWGGGGGENIPSLVRFGVTPPFQTINDMLAHELKHEKPNFSFLFFYFLESPRFQQSNIKGSYEVANMLLCTIHGLARALLGTVFNTC